MIEAVTTRLAHDNAQSVREAADVLAGGGLVAFPTETVYGLGADATNDTAVAKLFAAKGRPSFNPLIAHVTGMGDARKLAEFDDAAERLAAAFWPGPLTLVLPKSLVCSVSELATAGLTSIAVRVPVHPTAQALLAAFGRPVVAPSANRSGHVSPTTAEHVFADLNGRVDLIVDGGATPVGVESTIVACLSGEPLLLRHGGISRDDVARVLGRPLQEAAAAASDDEAPLAPGMLTSHYAPKARLRLNATQLEAGEALLAFGTPLSSAAPTALLNLSPTGDVVEAAANLYAHLRMLDRSAAAIAVMPIPNEGLGEAINDRLRRAAAPRI